MLLTVAMADMLKRSEKVSVLDERRLAQWVGVSVRTRRGGRYIQRTQPRTTTNIMQSTTIIFRQRVVLESDDVAHRSGHDNISEAIAYLTPSLWRLRPIHTGDTEASLSRR